MEEYWDLYDKNRNKLDKVVKRGEKLQDDEYHLVVNAWIKNSKNEFLITQRSENKSHPLMWECTGGSALKGESSKKAALREIKEELGINVDESTGKLIGTTLRYYPNCPDILDVWVFESDIAIDCITIQEEEVNDAMWASVEKIKELHDENKFEANAFFEDVLKNLSEDIYYIGFNANNAICNDSFFKGSITLYPTKERGNIYFSDKVLYDTKSNDFMKTYKSYVYKTAKKIQNANVNAKFICFNEKIRKLCSDMNDINIIRSNDPELIDFLNNKFRTRDLVKDIVPIFDYYMLNEKELDYQFIKEKLNSDKFVIQAETGAGGDSTYLITNESDMKLLDNTSKKYCVSKYVKHLPLNVTLIVGQDDIILLPLSAQLILLTDNKFKYVGGDFDYIKKLDFSIKEKINIYSLKIAERIKDKGYRGILGIDFVLCENNEIVFMEINPRFQSSSFLISLYLDKNNNTNIAELHYLAMTNNKLKSIKMDKINQSFVNCNIIENFDKLSNFKEITNGYFKDNLSSNYRKVFDRSILDEYDFEKI
ncbi:MAG: ATP-grasp domain-containing protein [Bacilli bacterium]|nr:ATP-grasp domain-containing protein [Bacilli bacterium]